MSPGYKFVPNDDPNSCANCAHCRVVVSVKTRGDNIITGLHGLECGDQPLKRRWWHFGHVRYMRLDTVFEPCSNHERVVVPDLAPLWALKIIADRMQAAKETETQELLEMCDVA